MPGTAAAAPCALEAEFTGAFSRDMGTPRVLVGWGPVAGLLQQGGVMGKAPDPADFDREASTAVLVLSPFATNTGQRPEIRVRIGRGVARISARTKPPGPALMVLNHPFWVGVFKGDCAFDLRNLPGG